MTQTDNLTDLLLDDRIEGLSFDRIGKKHGIDPLDARMMVREALARSAEEDDWEMRALTLLRLEKVVQNLWSGVEQGSFKHAEALFKGLEQISALLALNKQVMEEQTSTINDEQAALVYEILTENNKHIYSFIEKKLKPNKTQKLQLEEWPAVVAEASTAAIEANLMEDDDE